jgi:predicted metal-dependent hydrolase
MMELNYKIIRSPKRKKLTITVERDRTVVIRAPEGASDKDVGRIFDSKRQWVLEKLRHPQKYRDRAPVPGKEMVSRESALYLGREYRIEVTETTSGEIEFSHLFRMPAAHLAKNSKALRDWYFEKAKEKILARVEQQARMLGVEFVAAKIVDNRYRWGSCTVNDNINLNWRLIKAPIFVIDYVIIHELAHLIEANHTSRFWSIVRASTPAMEKAKSWLKDHGQILEDET